MTIHEREIMNQILCQLKLRPLEEIETFRDGEKALTQALQVIKNLKKRGAHYREKWREAELKGYERLI